VGKLARKILPGKQGKSKKQKAREAMEDKGFEEYGGSQVTDEGPEARRRRRAALNNTLLGEDDFRLGGV